jgi:hypothetical protein
MATMLTLQARRVLLAFRGSSWPVLVDAGDCQVVVKLRGTAEGVRPLVAEIVVGALADALGLPTPERVLVELPPHVPSNDPHEELRDLLDRSPGSNLGFRYLEGFRNVTLADAERIKPELAAAIVWLDALVQNPDRTSRNTNLMIKAGQIWLIDHGAALTFHHDWHSVTEQTPRDAGSFVAEHLLNVSEAQLRAADAELAPKIKRETLERALAEVPESFLVELGAGDPARVRAGYVAYLWKRLRAPRPFVAGDRHTPFQFPR